MRFVWISGWALSGPIIMPTGSCMVAQVVATTSAYTNYTTFGSPLYKLTHKKYLISSTHIGYVHTPGCLHLHH